MKMSYQIEMFHFHLGFPTSKRIYAGDVDAHSILFDKLRSHTLVLTSGVPEDVLLNPKDSFNNPIEKCRLPRITPRISFHLWYIDSIDGGKKRYQNNANFVIYQTSNDNLCISVAFSPGEEGWYEAKILLDEEPVASASLTLIVLSRSGTKKVDQILANRKNREFYALESDYIEADLLIQNGQKVEKPKKVYCYLTDKQLAIREFFLKIFLKRTFGYRLVPATKINLVRYQANVPVIRIEDGHSLNSLEICSRDGVVLVSCFHKILLEKLGGSETFEAKRSFFNTRLLLYHEKKSHKHVPLNVRISRFPSVLQSTYQVTKSMSDHDWAKLFVIEFEQELGIDHGGLVSKINRYLESAKNENIFIILVFYRDENGLVWFAKNYLALRVTYFVKWKKAVELCFQTQSYLSIPRESKC